MPNLLERRRDRRLQKARLFGKIATVEGKSATGHAPTFSTAFAQRLRPPDASVDKIQRNKTPNFILAMSFTRCFASAWRSGSCGGHRSIDRSPVPAAHGQRGWSDARPHISSAASGSSKLRNIGESFRAWPIRNLAFHRLPRTREVACWIGRESAALRMDSEPPAGPERE